MSGVSWDDDAFVDIGHGVEITFQTDTDTGERIGIIERHACAAQDGRPTRGSVPFAGTGVDTGHRNGSRWTVESWEPLTLSPSIQCQACPHHGWIRDGQWVPA